MAHRTLIDGTGYDIKSGRTLILGTGYNIKKGRTLIGGTGYDIKFGTPVGELDVGTSVYMNVDSVRKEWIVVHQGLPTSTPTYYDDTCSGTWLLMKELCAQSYFMYTSSEAPNVDRTQYENSKADAYLRNTFLPLLDTNVQAIIKEINLPLICRNSATYGSPTIIARKIFLLDRSDLIRSYWADETYEGLSYFSDGTSEKRIAYYESGTADGWFLRDDASYDSSTKKYYVNGVSGNGNTAGLPSTSMYGIRPALVLPSDDALVDDEFNIVA